MVAIDLEDQSVFIEQLQAGSFEAFERLDRKYRGRMIGLALYILGSRSSKYCEEAEDIVQSALLNIFRGIKSFNRDLDLFTWMTAILKNQCLDYSRKSETHRVELSQSLNGKESSVIDRRANAEESVEHSQLRKLLLEKLATMKQRGMLTDGMCRVIMARSFDGDSYAKIANSGSVSSNLNTLRVKNNRGIERLKNAILYDRRFKTYLAGIPKHQKIQHA